MARARGGVGETTDLRSLSGQLGTGSHARDDGDDSIVPFIGLVAMSGFAQR